MALSAELSAAPTTEIWTKLIFGIDSILNEYLVKKRLCIKLAGVRVMCWDKKDCRRTLLGWFFLVQYFSKP